jgi:putative endonuclease
MRSGILDAVRRFFLGDRWQPASDTGIAGERAAEKHLKSLGYKVLARNARTRGGEVDLVVEGPDRAIALVEVKARVVVRGRNDRPGEAAVNIWKRRRLLNAARILCAANRWQDRRIRIDVIVVEWDAPRTHKDPPSRIRHTEGLDRFK